MMTKAATQIAGRPATRFVEALMILRDELAKRPVVVSSPSVEPPRPAPTPKEPNTLPPVASSPEPVRPVVDKTTFPTQPRPTAVPPPPVPRPIAPIAPARVEAPSPIRAPEPIRRAKPPLETTPHQNGNYGIYHYPERVEVADSHVAKWVEMLKRSPKLQEAMKRNGIKSEAELQDAVRAMLLQTAQAQRLVNQTGNLSFRLPIDPGHTALTPTSREPVTQLLSYILKVENIGVYTTNRGEREVSQKQLDKMMAVFEAGVNLNAALRDPHMTPVGLERSIHLFWGAVSAAQSNGAGTYNPENPDPFSSRTVTIFAHVYLDKPIPERLATDPLTKNIRDVSANYDQAYRGAQ